MWSHHGNIDVAMAHPAPNRDLDGSDDAKGVAYMLFRGPDGPQAANEDVMAEISP